MRTHLAGSWERGRGSSKQLSSACRNDSGIWDFPDFWDMGGPEVCLPAQEVQVQSLVGKLRLYTPQGQKTNM